MARSFYKKECQTVGLSVGPSVGPSVGQSVGRFVHGKFAESKIQNLWLILILWLISGIVGVTTKKNSKEI